MQRYKDGKMEGLKAKMQRRKEGRKDAKMQKCKDRKLQRWNDAR